MPFPRTSVRHRKSGKPQIGWLDARHTAGTPTGPATPATVFGLHPLSLFGGRVFRSPLLALPPLCVLAVLNSARPSPGVSYTLEKDGMRYRDNLRRPYFAL